MKNLLKHPSLDYLVKFEQKVSPALSQTVNSFKDFASRADSMQSKASILMTGLQTLDTQIEAAAQKNNTLKMTGVGLVVGGGVAALTILVIPALALPLACSAAGSCLAGGAYIAKWATNKNTIEQQRATHAEALNSDIRTMLDKAADGVLVHPVFAKALKASFAAPATKQKKTPRPTTPAPVQKHSRS